MRIDTDFGTGRAPRWAGRGTSFGDLDNDGDVDVVINRMDGRPAVLLNESARGHWIRLDLVGTKSNRDACGARCGSWPRGSQRCTRRASCTAT